MRPEVDPARVKLFLEGLGRAARSPGRVYLTGGATAVLKGWRASTVDVDIEFDPEADGVFEAIPDLKQRLLINVELASPALFIPVPAAWRCRSEWIGTFGKLDAFHFDFTAQALAKIERDHVRDRADVNAMLASGLVTRHGLLDGFEQIRPLLVRFPAVDPVSFERRLRAVCTPPDDSTSGGPGETLG